MAPNTLSSVVVVLATLQAAFGFSVHSRDNGLDIPTGQSDGLLSRSPDAGYLQDPWSTGLSRRMILSEAEMKLNGLNQPSSSNTKPNPGSSAAAGGSNRDKPLPLPPNRDKPLPPLPGRPRRNTIRRRSMNEDDVLFQYLAARGYFDMDLEEDVLAARDFFDVEMDDELNFAL